MGARVVRARGLGVGAGVGWCTETWVTLLLTRDCGVAGTDRLRSGWLGRSQRIVWDGAGRGFIRFFF